MVKIVKQGISQLENRFTPNIEGPRQERSWEVIIFSILFELITSFCVQSNEGCGWFKGIYLRTKFIIDFFQSNRSNFFITHSTYQNKSLRSNLRLSLFSLKEFQRSILNRINPFLDFLCCSFTIIVDGCSIRVEPQSGISFNFNIVAYSFLNWAINFIHLIFFTLWF